MQYLLRRYPHMRYPHMRGHAIPSRGTSNDTFIPDRRKHQLVAHGSSIHRHTTEGKEVQRHTDRHVQTHTFSRLQASKHDKEDETSDKARHKATILCGSWMPPDGTHPQVRRLDFPARAQTSVPCRGQDQGIQGMHYNVFLTHW
jgi:hypothetical protein